MNSTLFDLGDKSPFRYTCDKSLPVGPPNCSDVIPTGLSAHAAPGKFNGYFMLKVVNADPLKIMEASVDYTFVQDGNNVIVTGSGTNQIGVYDLKGTVDPSTGFAQLEKQYRPVPAKTPRASGKKRAVVTRNKSAKKPVSTPRPKRPKETLVKPDPITTSVPVNGEDPSRQRSHRKRRAPVKELPGSDFRTRLPEEMRICDNIVKKLMAHKWADPFNLPIDIEGLGLHDYLTIVSEPMDFRTVKERIHTDFYSSYCGFEKDMMLVFDNATLYNRPGSDVHTMAKTLCKLFKQQLAANLSKLRACETKRARTPGGFKRPRVNTDDGSVGRSAKTQRLSTPRQRQSNFGGGSAKDDTIDLLKQELFALKQQVATMASMPKSTGKRASSVNLAARTLNFNEKKKLSLGINKLPGDKLARVVSIIRENGMPLGGKGATDEIEIDIDALDTITLRKLQKYVKASLAPKAKPRKRKADNFSSLSKATPGVSKPELLEHVEKVEMGTQQRLEAVRAQLQGLAEGRQDQMESREGSALFANDMNSNFFSDTDTTDDSDA
jgi:hypothetical protein